MDLDFLLAKVHGLRSKLYEGDALLELLRAGSLVQLAGLLFPGEAFADHFGIQRRLMLRHSQRMWQIAKLTSGRRGDVFQWLAMRTLLENLKVLVRCRSLPGDPLVETARFLVPCPDTPQVELRDAIEARDTAALARLVPRAAEPLARGLMQFEDRFRQTSNPFFLEVGLDAAYFAELRDRLGRLPLTDQNTAGALLRRQIVTYDILAALRARLVFEQPPEAVAPVLVRVDRLDGPALSRLAAVDHLSALRECLPEAMADYVAPEAREIDDQERHMWRRLHRLAGREYVASAWTLGAVAAYIVFRQVELINLVRVVEGVRLDMDRKQLADQLMRLEPAAASV